MPVAQSETTSTYYRLRIISSTTGSSEMIEPFARAEEASAALEVIRHTRPDLAGNAVFVETVDVVTTSTWSPTFPHHGVVRV